MTRFNTSTFASARRHASTTSPPPRYPFTLRGQISKLRQRYPSAEPVSLIGSFLILHEVTAFIPLLGLFAILQQTDSRAAAKAVDWIANDAKSDGYLHGALVESERKIERVGTYYGWFGYTKRRKGDDHLVEEPDKAQAITTKATQATANAIAAYLIIKVCMRYRTGL